MGMKIRLTALILAASLTVNMVTLPVKAEEDTTPVEQQTTITEPSSGAGTVSGTEQSAAEPVESQPASSESTDQEPEPAETTAPVTEPTKSATEPAEPKESTDQETEQLLIGQPNSLQTNDTLLLEPEEAALPALMALDAGTGTGELTPSKIKQVNPIDAYPNNTRITINDANELAILSTISADKYQYCELYFVNNSSAFDTTATAFTGLGKEAPFSGTVTLANSTTNPIKLNVPLFKNLSDSAVISKLILQYAKEGDNGHTAILAENVIHGETPVEGNVDWMITLQKPDDEGEMADIVSTCLIGTIGESCNISLSVTDNIGKPVIGSSSAGFLCSTLNGSLTMKGLDRTNPISVTAKSGNAGGLVGEMGANGSLTVNLNLVTENDISKPATLKIKDVSATGNAGGLVGKMAAGATLTINTDVEMSGSVTASGGDAGGLVGLAEHSTESLSTVTIKAVTSGGNEPVINSVLTLTGAISSTSSSGGGLIGSATDIIFDGGLPMISGTGSISGANAGGLIGSYTYSGVSGVLSTVSQNISGITVNGSSNAGGVFGVLRNNSTFTINPTIPDAGTDAVSVTFGGGSTGNVGGLIGNYQAGNLENAALYLAAQAVTSALTSSATTYGGLIGLVGDQDNGVANYIEIGTTQTTTTVTTASGASATDFGGLIAKLTNSGHMVKTVGAVKVINSLPGSSTCGGLVGYMPSGVLWLGGSVDVGDVTTGGNILQNRGWILGSRDNTLVFTDQSDWNYAKGSNTNDIGNWGQVLSIPNICTNSTDDLLTVADHKVTVAAATSGDNTYSIGSPLEFAAIALRLQLDNQETGALNIPDDFSGDLDITLTSDIVLSGTGLTGFQRDYEIGNAAPNVTLTGTKGEGGAYSITLPDITVYIRDNSHKRQGLITKASFLDVSNLTISTPAGGSFKVEAQDGSNFYMGALAAEVTGKIDLTNVTGSAVLDITGSGSDSAAGGLIAVDTGNAVTMRFTGCTWDGELSANNGQSGLYMGGLLGRVKEQKAHTVTITNCTICGKMDRTGSSTPEENRMGAMIGSLIGQSIENPLKLEIDGLTVRANVTSNATQHAGALLSYEWYCTEAIVKNVKVTDSSLNATSRFGGLVYKGSGYWSIQPTAEGVPGITISNSTFEGKNSSGLLVCHAENTYAGALYLEILYGGYRIGEGVTVTGVTAFDEIAGCTKGSNGNGIVSIATKDHELIDSDSTPNTYVNQLTDYSFTNGNTRYYYNLDSFGAVVNPPSGAINSPAKMVMYSAFSHADDSIQKYFYTSLGHITGIIDLTGYSYYPAEEYTNISDADIKFAFEEINGKETDNKTLDDSNKQHAGMHTGIFTGVSGGGTVNVGNLTLQGTVGGLGNNFGALIRDNAQGGSDTSNMADLKINGVTLNGIQVYPTLDNTNDVKPLLIHSLGSFTSLDMSNVTTTAAYANMTETDGQYAASSLIGPVGSDTASYIQLEFKDMRLDGRINADSTQTKVHETYRSIFSRASFMESFQYGNASTCRGVYNFNKSTDDVPSYYTLGKELSNTTSGRNQGLQYWFFDTDDYVCGSEADADTAYATGYLPYVCHSEEDKWHELDVNLKSTGLTVGCGTYTDPYIITDGQQLVDLSKALAEGGLKENWEINLDENVLGKTFSLEGPKDENGKHTCKKYTGSATGWRKDDETVDNKTATATNVLAYLRNAYYKIEQDITISSNTWAGLGITSDKNDKAFSGVFYGNPMHPNGNVTITIENPSQETQFGGLIKFSLGSVIKDVNIVYQTQPQVNTYVENGATNIPSTTTNASFFGGVVGWCLGGDTIIDNVTVTYQNGEPAVSGNNGHLTAVGGYVGMVGGAINDAGDRNREKYGGGVVFRNMTDGSGLTGGKAYESSNYFYYNPYVGRVLDGYAMLENPTADGYATKLENTDKNYTIPTISAGTHLTVNGGTVTVNDAQGLWLLSAIANSGAGSMANDSANNNNYAYNYGKPRTGTYQKIGEAIPDVDKTDETYLGGVSSKKGTQSYLTQDKYVSGELFSLCSSSGVSIVLNSDCDMSLEAGFGNGFRGIGASYATPANGNSNYRLIPVSSITSAEGKTCTVTLGQSRKEYTEEKNNWTSIGSGLFVLLRIGGDSLVASNLNLSGKTGITYYEGTSIATAQTTGLSDAGKRDNNKRLSLVGVGMLVGNLASVDNNSQITLDSVHLLGTKDEKVTVNVDDDGSMGTTFAGGLAGYLWINSKSITKLTLRDCTYEHLSVRGRIEAGGFIGYTTAQEVSIEYTSDAELKDGTVKTTLNKCNQYDGVGGLIGEVNNGKLDINAAGISSLTVRDLSVSASVNGIENNVGGLIGVLRAADAKACVLKNIHMEGEIELAGSLTTSSNVKSNVGLIAGGILDKDGSWNNAGTASYNFEVSNFRVAQENGSNVKLYRGWQVGGLIGLYRTGNKNGYGTLKLDDIRFGSESNTISILNGTNIDGSHNCAASCLVATSCLVPQVEVTDVQIVNTKILSRKYGAFLYARIDNQSDATQTIDFKNISIENSTVAVSNGPSNNTNDSAESYYGIGALYGRIDNKGATITGCNILFRDCQIGFHVANDGSRKLAGITNDMPQTLNVGLSNSTATQKNTSYLRYDDISENERSNYTRGNIAIFGGSLANDTNKSVKLVGVSIQQQENTLPMKDFGTNPSSYYVVRADYKGYQDGTITGAKAPYVTTSPLSPLNTPDKTITGDGASFTKNAEGKDTSVAVATQILADLANKLDGSPADNLNLKHSAANAYDDSENRKAYEYLSEYTDKTKFGPFSTEGGNGDNYTGLDFPVLTLVTNSSTEANSLLYSWISLLANRDITPNTPDVTIKATNYRWNGTDKKWELDSSKDKSFDWTENKKIQLNKGTYDSAQNRFTLLDVAFEDPANDRQYAYHLYIPVVMQKIMKFHFWASAQTGTSYIKSTYDNLSALAAASHGEQVTVLLGYDYFERNRTEWEKAIANGDNLLFGFEKTLLLDQGQGLPNGTCLTLVDCSQQNRAYYATKDNTWQGENAYKVDFTNFEDSDGNPWAPLQLWEMLDLQAKKGSGKYYKKPKGNEEATLKATLDGSPTDFWYYSGDDGDTAPPDEDAYTIAIGENAKWFHDVKSNTDYLAERYYLTIQTPTDADGVYNNLIKCPSSLGASGLPTLRVKNPPVNEYPGAECARNNAENRVLIGDFFDHTVGITTTESNGEMSTEKHTIAATLTATLAFKKIDDTGTTSKSLFQDYAGQQNLYQRFELSMQEWDKDGQSSPRTMLPGTRITAKFYLDGQEKGTTYSDTIGFATSSYYLDFPEIPISDLTSSQQNSFTFKAEITLEYPDATLVDQFPEIENPDSDNKQGIVLGAGSYLAYTAETRSTTTLHAPTKWLSSPRFYRGIYRAASLNYYPVDAGKGVENVNQLGVNGFLSSSQMISSKAYYDISALDGAKDADSIQCTLKLYQKNDDTYRPIDETDWTKYLKDGMAVTIRYNEGTVTNATRNGETFTIPVTNLDKDKLVEIMVDMEVLTGSAFEENNLTYANYKVELEAVLKKGNTDIGGSRASDHIVYTNAKINPNPVRP